MLASPYAIHTVTEFHEVIKTVGAYLLYYRTWENDGDRLLLLLLLIVVSVLLSDH